MLTQELLGVSGGQVILTRESGQRGQVMLTRQSLGVSEGSNRVDTAVARGRLLTQELLGVNEGQIMLTRESLGVNGGSNHVDTGDESRCRSAGVKSC